MRRSFFHAALAASLLALFLACGSSMAGAYIGRAFSFASEAVPLSRAEVYESLDQELLLISEAKARVWLCLRRSPRTLPIVEKALKEAGVPGDFKYLPMALASLDPSFRQGKRAGIWRLSEEEAKATGLVVSRELDERLDPEAASRAASGILKAYHDHYGSWVTALAAFLDGPALVAASREAGGEKDYFKLYVPDALDKAVSQVFAGKILFSNPGAFGYNLSKPWPELSKKRIKTAGAATMAELSKKHEVDYKTLRDMNPHVLTDAVPAGAFLNVP